jgi:hypothetical protein
MSSIDVASYIPDPSSDSPDENNENNEEKEGGFDPDARTPGVWETMAGNYFPATDRSRVRALEPGVYSYRAAPGIWWLAVAVAQFSFGFRLYDTHAKIVERSLAVWNAEGNNNVGILLNGEKGSGKTVAVQMICNELIRQGIPVLVVRDPVPLDTILGQVRQDLVVVFDEFEKTHAKPEQQQALLSAIDGMSRSPFKRMFLFTTNMATIDTNFIDRPSRVRYIFSFGRLADPIVESIVKAELDPALASFEPDILTYLSNRRVLTIDTVRTTIREVNLFREAPSEFESIFNVSAMDAPYFKVDIIDEKGDVVRTLFRFFSPRSSYANMLRNYISSTGRKVYGAGDLWCMLDGDSGQGGIYLIRYNPLSPEAKDEFVAQVRIPARETWKKAYDKVFELDELHWVDAKPENWEVPDWVLKKQMGQRLTKTDREQENKFEESSVYGTNNRAEVLVRVSLTKWADSSAQVKRYMTSFDF